MSELVGKYGVLNSNFHKNIKEENHEYVRYTGELVRIENEWSQSNLNPLTVSVKDKTVFFVSHNEIDILNDNDPIIKLKVGGSYDYQFEQGKIVQIDYRYRKMDLAFDSGAMLVVDVPKFEEKKEEEKESFNLGEIFEAETTKEKLPKNTNHALHKKLSDEMHQTYLVKNQDYGNSFSEQYKKFGVKSAFIRMDDKMRRIEQLMENPAKVKGESMKDSVQDLANYALMTWMELVKEEENNAV